MLTEPLISWEIPANTAIFGDRLTISFSRDTMTIQSIPPTLPFRWTEPYACMTLLEEHRDCYIIVRDRTRTWTLPKNEIPAEAVRILRHEFARKFKKAWW